MSFNITFADNPLLLPQKPKAERQDGRNLAEMELISPEQTVCVLPGDNVGDGRNAQHLSCGDSMVTADDVELAEAAMGFPEVDGDVINYDAVNRR